MNIFELETHVSKQLEKLTSQAALLQVSPQAKPCDDYLILKCYASSYVSSTSTPTLDCIIYPEFLSSYATTAGLNLSQLGDLLSRDEHLSQGQVYLPPLKKNVLEPRLTSWYGEGTYTYSGKLMKPFPWSDQPELLSLKSWIEQRLLRDHGLDVSFTSALINLYRNERDSVGWHADDEPELGPHPVIASLSFGATRSFQLRAWQSRPKPPVLDIPLQGGSLLIMKGATQKFWKHRIPKVTSSPGLKPRVNVTFRVIH